MDQSALCLDDHDRVSHGLYVTISASCEQQLPTRFFQFWLLISRAIRGHYRDSIWEIGGTQRDKHEQTGCATRSMLRHLVIAGVIRHMLVTTVGIRCCPRRKSTRKLGQSINKITMLSVGILLPGTSQDNQHLQLTCLYNSELYLLTKVIP